MKINKIGKKYVSVDVHENETGETVWTGVLYIEETVLKAGWFKYRLMNHKAPLILASNTTQESVKSLSVCLPKLGRFLLALQFFPTIPG